MDQHAHDNVCHVYIDSEPHPGDWNMAADEFLLQAAMERGQCSVRVYRWAVPTLSLGYFQTPDDIPEPLRSAGLPIVRRLSGGGTILHHHELTYSCAVPAGHELARSPKELYHRAHEVIIRQLDRWGIASRLRGTAEDDRRDEFLCFARGDSFDVVMGPGHKVVGSAQRRRKGAVLQHGSVVLRRSALAPQFPGIEDLAGWPVPADELATALLFGFAARLAARSIRSEWTHADSHSIRTHTSVSSAASTEVF